MSQCFALILYQPMKQLARMWKDNDVWSGAFPYCTPYMKHLENTVGLLFSMEKGNSEQDESLGHVKSNEVDMTE